MNHKKCGGTITIDCSSMFALRSPSIRITSNGVVPGVVQLESVKSKSNPKLVCRNCNETFSTKEELEEGIEGTCILCKEKKSPSKLFFVEGLSFVCVECRDKVIKNKVDGSFDKAYLYFGEIIKKEYQTLLTILMKR